MKFYSIFVILISNYFFAVEIINGKVNARRPDDPNEMFVPTVTSQLKITVNEGNALIQCHDSDDVARFESLLKLPTKSINSLRSLKFVLDNIEELRDQFIDLLVVVTFVRFQLGTISINCLFISKLRN